MFKNLEEKCLQIYKEIPFLLSVSVAKISFIVLSKLQTITNSKMINMRHKLLLLVLMC